MSNFNFDSKETYLAWVADWKIHYAELSQAQRDERKQIKQQQRDGVSPYRLCSSTNQRKYFASEALIRRADAKVEAQRQYQEARQVQC